MLLLSVFVACGVATKITRREPMLYHNGTEAFPGL